ncbi:unnamed protein product [Citrullus colocynthis]|uniref:Uncharacterized protein n=1 Tax=Citrullus colocynthis TaxID=252529 RepID=A0ABP0YDT3_9ROSI
MLNQVSWLPSLTAFNQQLETDPSLSRSSLPFFNPTWHPQPSTTPLYKGGKFILPKFPNSICSLKKHHKVSNFFFIHPNPKFYMGNCLRRDGEAAQWAGEEWDFLATEDDDGREELLSDSKKKKCSTAEMAAASTTATEVKIKITKRQLEELLGKVDVKEMSVQQVLAQLIGVGDQFHESRHRHWRPVLQSIPEVD